MQGAKGLGEGAFTLIELIGVLAIMAILGALIVPNVISRLDAATRDAEIQNLKAIARGVELSLRENRAWPPTLASLSPEYVPFGSAQITQNERGYPRYYFAHPTTSGFSNATGLAASDLPDTRFLLISDLSQDAAPTITNATEFNAWWNTDETSLPDLKIYRGHVGNWFHLVSLSAEGDGGSYQIDGTSTNSGGGTLSWHSMYHLAGTPVGLDEADTYGTPEIQFSLASDIGYVFDPDCDAGSQWNPLGRGCPGSGGGGGSPIEVSAVNTVQTSSSSFTLIPGMTTTPPAGTYYASFSTSGASWTGDINGNYAIYVDGSKVGHSERLHDYKSLSDAYVTFHTQAIVTVTGSEAVEVRYKTNQGLFRMRERSLILLNLG